MKETLVLGIESSCDETSVAVVKNGREVLSNVIDTQIKIHEQFGGVVPEIASRNHIEAISRVTKLDIRTSKCKIRRYRCNSTNIWTRFSRSIISRSFIWKRFSICIKQTTCRSKPPRRTYIS